MDLTGNTYLHKDISVTACAQQPHNTQHVNTFPLDHTKLLETPSFAPDFVALVASNPTNHQALCCYSTRRPFSYSEALHILARQAEILWYNNHPEVPPSFSHCFRSISESPTLKSKVMRDATPYSGGIYDVQTNHAYALRNAWFSNLVSQSPTLHMINISNSPTTIESQPGTNTRKNSTRTKKQTINVPSVQQTPTNTADNVMTLIQHLLIPPITGHPLP